MTSLAPSSPPAPHTASRSPSPSTSSSVMHVLPSASSGYQTVRGPKKVRSSPPRYRLLLRRPFAMATSRLPSPSTSPSATSSGVPRAIGLPRRHRIDAGRMVEEQGGPDHEIDRIVAIHPAEGTAGTAREGVRSPERL